MIESSPKSLSIRSRRGLQYGMILFFSMVATLFSQGAPNSIKVAPSGDQSFDLYLERFAEAADQDISFYLSGMVRSFSILFYTTKQAPEGPLFNAVQLDPSASALNRELTIIRELTESRLPKAGTQSAPPWFVAGIYHRVHSQFQGHLPEHRFPASQRIVRNQIDVALSKLIAMPPPVAHPAVYDVYADMCAAMLEVFQRRSIGALTRILLLTNPSDPKTLATVLGITGDTLDPWFEKEFADVAQPPRLGAAKTVAEIERLIRTHLTANNNEAPIEVLVQSLDITTVSKEAKREFLTGCYQLRIQCPALLTTAFDRMILAANHLQSNKNREFMKQFPEAWKNFRKQERYAAALAAYLQQQSNAAEEMLVYRRSQIIEPATMDYERKLLRFLRD